MTEITYLDPLKTAQRLLDHISGKDGTTPTLNSLAERLDALMYALRIMPNGSVASFSEFEMNAPEESYESWRRIIAPRFPMISWYWKALSSRITNETPEIGTGDAIDDLADIAEELTIVEAHLNTFGREEAIAALRQAYELHLHMHISPLRAHLEELMFE